MPTPRNRFASFVFSAASKMSVVMDASMNQGVAAIPNEAFYDGEVLPRQGSAAGSLPSVDEEAGAPNTANPATQTDEGAAQDFLCAICDGEVLLTAQQRSLQRISSYRLVKPPSSLIQLHTAFPHVLFLAEAVRQEVLRFFDDQAVPDLRSTMTCTSELESYIGQVDDALDAEKAAVKDESAKLEHTVDQLMSKLQNIHRPAAAP